MQSLIKVFAFVSCFFLGGCATGYQKENFFFNGYSDQKVGKDTFLITYRANEHTPPEDVHAYALRRAAEVTLENGFQYFTVNEEIDSSKEEELIDVPMGGERSSFNRSYYPCLHMKIKCYADKPSKEKVYEAKSLLS